MTASWAGMTGELLFDQTPPFPRERLARRLRELAAESIYIGTSSWKYEGWLGQVYSRHCYTVRGRFSQARFEASCLAEYAETFPAVCGDFSFYQFPSPTYWHRLFASAPRSLLYAFKVPEEITARVWPQHARYGARAGLENPRFLDPELFRTAFLDLLEPYREQVAVLIFEFGAFPKNTYQDVSGFLQQLDPFLRALPAGYRYSVEVRNPEYLEPEYFGCLRSRGVAHVFNAWTRMPPMGVQLRIPGAITADFLVARALLPRGTAYQQAVDTFAPYREIQEPQPQARQALKDMIAEARRMRHAAFLFVNNRLEGNAPGTILAVVED